MLNPSTAALEKVETTASTTPPSSDMDATQQGMLEELKGASGGDFQASYVQMQTDAYRGAVTLAPDA